MLGFLGNNDSFSRKHLLFCVACARREWHRLTESAKAIVETTERYADGQGTRKEYFDAHDSAFRIKDTDEAYRAIYWDDYEEQDPFQVSIVRDLVGNPFQPPPTMDRALVTWNNGAVVTLAKAIYDARAFDRMPELADVLEQAGCTNADILNHCRQPGVHVRGCWVVDLLLAMEYAVHEQEIDDFDFGTDETFCFFVWVCAPERGPDALIAKAFKKAKQPQVGLLDDEARFIVRDHLADELHNLLVHAAGTPDPLLDRRLHPLGLAQVNCQAVAQALLMRAGKWRSV
jgi:hypothetical protein